MRRIRTAGLGLCLLLSTSTLSATSLRIVNLFEMLELADRVFWGRCQSAELQPARAGLPPAVEYVFEVVRGVKGTRAGETMVFRQILGARRGSAGIAGVPHYRKGEEMLLFLHGDSRLGLTSPVGLAQGVFRLEGEEGGKIGFINVLENRNLSHGLSQEEARESGLSAAERSQLGNRAPIAVDRFIGLVEKVSRYQSLRNKSDR